MDVAGTVADFELGHGDKYGIKVTRIFARKPPQYCVYVADDRVQVCFADTTQGDLESKQRKALSALAPLRGEIDGLLDGWRVGTNRTPLSTRRGSDALRAKAELYNRRVADSLIVALEDDIQGATGILDKIKQDILDERVSRARFEYLIAAVLTAIILMFVGWLVTATYPMDKDTDQASRAMRVGGIVLSFAGLAAIGLFYMRLREWVPPGVRPDPGEKAEEDNYDARSFFGGLWQAAAPALLLFVAIAIPVWAMLQLKDFLAIVDKRYPVSYADSVTMWRAAAAGSVGAFFSIAIGIRGRTVLPDLRRTSNLMDAALRVTIGFIGAAVFMALLILKVVSFKMGDFAIDSTHLVGVLFAGFLAGFSERLVPDLLDKASARPGAPPPAPPPLTPPPTIRDKATDKADSDGTTKPDDPDGPDPLPEEAQADGCASDHDVDDDQVMDDAQLPAASGGVAVVPGPASGAAPGTPPAPGAAAPAAPAAGGPTT